MSSVVGGSIIRGSKRMTDLNRLVTVRGGFWAQSIVSAMRVTMLSIGGGART